MQNPDNHNINQIVFNILSPSNHLKIIALYLFFKPHMKEYLSG